MSALIMAEARQRAASLALMAFDVDGVMTDGKLYFDADGGESKAFSVLDGQGLKMLREAGVLVALISARSSPALLARARNLGLEKTLFMGVQDKLQCLDALATEHGYARTQCGYMGDDVIDLAVMGAVGFAAAPANAHALVKRHVDWLSAAAGGEGAVRRLCDFILQAKEAEARLYGKYLPCDSKT